MINKETYKRLTKTDDDGKSIIRCGKKCPNYENCTGSIFDCNKFIIDHLAELEDKIMDGTLVEIGSYELQEIKKALECCVIHDCSDSCIFSEKHPFACLTEMHTQLLTLIKELESENKELRVVTDIANERTYRKKFTDEWRKEYQKELEKQGNGHIAGHPDFDLVYKLYFEQKDRITKLENEKKRLNKTINNIQKGFDNGEFISKDCKISALKQFAERLKGCAFCDEYGDSCVWVEEIEETLKEFIK